MKNLKQFLQMTHLILVLFFVHNLEKKNKPPCFIRPQLIFQFRMNVQRKKIFFQLQQKRPLVLKVKLLLQNLLNPSAYVTSTSSLMWLSLKHHQQTYFLNGFPLALKFIIVGSIDGWLLDTHAIVLFFNYGVTLVPDIDSVCEKMSWGQCFPHMFLKLVTDL